MNTSGKNLANKKGQGKMNTSQWYQPEDVFIRCNRFWRRACCRWHWGLKFSGGRRGECGDWRRGWWVINKPPGIGEVLEVEGGRLSHWD
jgi:hypothetical protein